LIRRRWTQYRRVGNSERSTADLDSGMNILFPLQTTDWEQKPITA